jgi:hypothetical protein
MLSETSDCAKPCRDFRWDIPERFNLATACCAGPGEADSDFTLSHGTRDRKMDNRSDIWRRVDAIKARFIALSDKVWATPEVCYTEARSSAEHLAELCDQGFRITENVAGIPTALMGEWGEGGPVIAFLGEYDALPGLSQEAGVAESRPVEAGGHGHGCGHNLLGWPRCSPPRP